MVPTRTGKMSFFRQGILKFYKKVSEKSAVYQGKLDQEIIKLFYGESKNSCFQT